jgi:hypothetical protein
LAHSAGPSLSEVLGRIAADESRSTVSVGDVTEALRDRATGALLLVFAMPNVLPMPPGTSAVLGAPLVFLTAQLALGRKPWLPRFIAGRRMERAHFATVVARIAPWIARAERALRPRLTALASPPFEYLIGLVCLVLSVILFLPIPMGNIPPAIAICVFALAIMERDGAWVLIGMAASGLALVIVWGVLVGLLRAGLFLLERWLH